jgi:hypothetical protein
MPMIIMALQKQTPSRLRCRESMDMLFISADKTTEPCNLSNS